MARNKSTISPISIGLYVFLSILLIIASAIFGVSEVRAVQNRIEILPLQQNVIPVSCEKSNDNEGRVVHIDCPLHNLHTFYPPAEFVWNLRPFRGVFLEMKVEMFQWMLRSQTLGFYFTGQWSSSLVDSSSYPFLFYNSHVNPNFMPTINGAGRRFAPKIYAGDFRLSQKHLVNFQSKKQLPLIDDGYYTPSVEHPPTSVSYLSTQVYHDALYTGDPKNPKIGDLRITFWGSTATHVSAIAQQGPGHLDGTVELVQLDTTSKNRTLTELVYEGDFTPKEMFRQYLTQRDGSPMIVWGVRLLTCMLLTAIVVTSHRMFNKSKKVAVLPLLLGSLLIAIGIVLLCVFPLWFLCDITKGVLLMFGSVLGIAGGGLIWVCWNQPSQNTDEEDSALEVLTTPAANNPNTNVNDAASTTNQAATIRPGESYQNDSRHYYQPV